MPLTFAKRVGLALVLIVSALLLLPEPAPAQQGTQGSWCVLRRRNIYEPASCFEFFLCDTTKDGQRCGLAGNACGVDPMGLREGWEVDPNAHPQRAPGPYETWQGGDYVMSVLSRFGGDWYQCRGPRTLDLPRRTPVGGGPSESGFCILSKPILNWPPNCFEFYLAAGGAGRVVIQGGACLVTTQAAREGWSVDLNMGGPHVQRAQAQAAHDRLNRFAGNFYGCSEGGTPPPPPPIGGGGNSDSGVVGRWKWFTNDVIEVFAGHRMVAKDGRGNVLDQGSWSLVDIENRTFKLEWEKGKYRDVLTLSVDGQRLDGSNQNGTHVWGERIR
jgi:hypothetical protein